VLPILVLLYVAPFVAGPERLARVLRGRRPDQGVIIDVTPRPAPRLPEPPADRHATPRAPDVADDAEDGPSSGPGEEADPR